MVNGLDQTFYAELRPVSERFVPAALNVTGFDLRELATRGQPPVTVMKNLLDWVNLGSRGGNPIFVGFNAAFDWSFVNWYFHRFLGKNPFGVAPLDIKAYYMGLTGCSWDETRTSQLPEFLKPNRSEKDHHNALADALYQAEIFRCIKGGRPDLSRS